MKIALAQMRVVPGKPERNFMAMERMIARAKGAGADLVAFPEMCVGGYLLGDLWTDARWCRHLMSFNDDLRALSEGIVLLYGNVWMDEGAVNRDGRERKYNAAYGFQDGVPLARRALPSGRKHPLPDGIAPKTLLPNYRIFDDERYFFSLLELSLDSGIDVTELLQPFAIRDKDRSPAGERDLLPASNRYIGLEVCEDLWFKDYRLRGEALDVTRHLMANGAGAIFNLSASPWTWGKDAARHNRIREVREGSGRLVPFHYVNCVGVQNNGKNFVTFDGDSAVWGPDGEVILEAREAYAEELLVYDEASLPAREPRPPRGKIRAKYEAAIEAFKGLDEIMGGGFPYIVGMSGGVDSSVVACLATIAAGKDRVVAFNLPGRWNGEALKGAAAHVARELGIPLHTVPIEEMAALNAAMLAPWKPGPLNLENIQAKVRGTSVLSNAAAALGGVMTNNGNKVEVAIGYATLYGDVDGAIAPLGDLLKTEVFELARHLNAEVFGREVIPAGLLPDADFNFALPPSAELRADQVDPMKWGYHDALLEAFTDYRKADAELVLQWRMEGVLAERLGIPESLIARYGLDDPAEFVRDLEWFAAGVQRAVFKRIQAPPVVVMSKGAYGYDIRESQLPLWFSRRYRELKEDFLASPAAGASEGGL